MTRQGYAIGSMLLIALSLLMAVLPAYAAAGEEASTALRRFYQKVDTLSGEFAQVQRDEQGQVLARSRGTFAIARPHRFRWEYVEPYRQIIVSDGEMLRTYDVDLAQVTVRPVTQALSDTPAMLLSGAPDLDRAFNIEPLPPADGLDWVKVTPQDENGDFRSLRLGFSEGVLQVMELADSLGQHSRITFSSLKVNQALPPARFQLDVPKNVDVIQ